MVGWWLLLAGMATAGEPGTVDIAFGEDGDVWALEHDAVGAWRLRRWDAEGETLLGTWEGEEASEVLLEEGLSLTTHPERVDHLPGLGFPLSVHRACIDAGGVVHFLAQARWETGGWERWKGRRGRVTEIHWHGWDHGPATLLSADAEGLYRSWEVSDERINGASCSARGDRLALGTREGTVLEFSIGSRTPRLEHRLRRPVRGLAVAEEGLVASSHHRVLWWGDARRRSLRLRGAGAVALSAEGDLVVAAGDEHIVWWEPRRRRHGVVAEAEVRALQVNPCGHRVAAIDPYGHLLLWDIHQ